MYDRDFDRSEIEPERKLCFYCNSEMVCYDDSFDHALGTETVINWVCENEECDGKTFIGDDE